MPQTRPLYVFAMKAMLFCWCTLMGLSISAVDKNHSVNFWVPPLIGSAVALIALRFGPAICNRVSISLPPLSQAYVTGHMTSLAGVFIASLGWLTAVFLHFRSGTALAVVGFIVAIVGGGIAFAGRKESSEA